MGLKWEVTPSLPQEPHYFSGGSSQKTMLCGAKIKYLVIDDRKL